MIACVPRHKQQQHAQCDNGVRELFSAEVARERQLLFPLRLRVGPNEVLPLAAAIIAAARLCTRSR
jgi:hypothetical protein